MWRSKIIQNALQLLLLSGVIACGSSGGGDSGKQEEVEEPTITEPDIGEANESETEPPHFSLIFEQSETTDSGEFYNLKLVIEREAMTDGVEKT